MNNKIGEVLDKLDMKIYFGPAGIPLSCKGRTLKDGIKDVRLLSLDFMEIQLVRGVGEEIPGLNEIKEMSEMKEVKLSVHAPYYMDLLGSPEGVKRSIDALRWAATVAHKIGAKLVVTHIGYYNGYSGQEAIDIAAKNIRKVRDWIRKKNYDVQIGLEPNGKQHVFGTIDEIIEVCKKVSRTVPVLNFAHIYARGGGVLRSPEDFALVFEKARSVIKDDRFYINFSGAIHDGKSLVRLTPIKRGDMKFEHLAETILDHQDWEYTIISSSPLLEHDALYMKLILERVQLKREAKAARRALKEETRKALEKKQEKTKEVKDKKKGENEKAKKKAKKDSKKKATKK